MLPRSGGSGGGGGLIGLFARSSDDDSDGEIGTYIHDFFCNSITKETNSAVLRALTRKKS